MIFVHKYLHLCRLVWDKCKWIVTLKNCLPENKMLWQGLVSIRIAMKSALVVPVSLLVCMFLRTREKSGEFGKLTLAADSSPSTKECHITCFYKNRVVALQLPTYSTLWKELRMKSWMGTHALGNRQNRPLDKKYFSQSF